MTFCLVPNPSSVTYLTGGGADMQDICPTVPLCHGADPFTIDSLRDMLTNWELTDLGNSAAAALGVLAMMLGAMVAPLLWAARAGFWILKGILSAVNLVAGKTGRILISPLLLPFRLVAWAWDMVLSILYRLEPMFAYFGCAIIIGTFSGAIIAMISRVFSDICNFLLPSRRRDRPRQPTHGAYQPPRNTRTPSHPPRLPSQPKRQPQPQPADEPADDPRIRAERLDEIRAQLIRNPPRRGGPIGRSPQRRGRRAEDSSGVSSPGLSSPGLSSPSGLEGGNSNPWSRRVSGGGGGATGGSKGGGKSSRRWRGRRSSQGNGKKQGAASPLTTGGGGAQGGKTARGGSSSD